LKDIPPAELATRVTAEAVRRASVAPAEIGHVVFGQVVQTEPRDMYVSRVAAVDAGIPVETPALTVNRLCGSDCRRSCRRPKASSSAIAISPSPEA
jgi:acetyl-CoA C-acetyltransferase